MTIPEDTLKRAQMQAGAIKAELALLEMAKKVITPEIESQTKAMFKGLLDARNIPFDVNSVTAYLEGARFAVTFVDEAKREEMMMFILSILKVKDTLEHELNK